MTSGAGSEQHGSAVFVVHGRNEALRRSMFDFLRVIGLQPVQWTPAVALSGKGSPYIGEVLDAAFNKASPVVVLMTLDDVAYLQPHYRHGNDDPEAPTPRRRRDRTCSSRQVWRWDVTRADDPRRGGRGAPVQ